MLNGTITNHAVTLIARYAPRTSRSSRLTSPAIARARKPQTAPSQPTEKVMCAVRANRRRPADEPGNACARLEAVLETYALIAHEQHSTELAALLHRGEHIVRAQQQLRDIVKNLLTEGARAGDVRGDTAPLELASYCLHALTAAGSLPTDMA